MAGNMNKQSQSPGQSNMASEHNPQQGNGQEASVLPPAEARLNSNHDGPFLEPHSSAAHRGRGSSRRGGRGGYPNRGGYGGRGERGGAGDGNPFGNGRGGRGYHASNFGHMAEGTSSASVENQQPASNTIGQHQKSARRRRRIYHATNGHKSEGSSSAAVEHQQPGEEQKGGCKEQKLVDHATNGHKTEGAPSASTGYQQLLSKINEQQQSAASASTGYQQPAPDFNGQHQEGGHKVVKLEEYGSNANKGKGVASASTGDQKPSSEIDEQQQSPPPPPNTNPTSYTLQEYLHFLDSQQQKSPRNDTPPLIPDTAPPPPPPSEAGGSTTSEDSFITNPCCTTCNKNVMEKCVCNQPADKDLDMIFNIKSTFGMMGEPLKLEDHKMMPAFLRIRDESEEVEGVMDDWIWTEM